MISKHEHSKSNILLDKIEKKLYLDNTVLVNDCHICLQSPAGDISLSPSVAYQRKKRK